MSSRTHLLFTGLATSSLLLLGCPGDDSPPDETGDTLIQTDKGPVLGFAMGQTRVFLGIPYAAPPVGALRWKSPQPASPWTETLEVITPGPICPQRDAAGTGIAPGSSEDCLTLNVWTPDPAPATPAPVMVWIHGGAFSGGAGSDPAFDGTALSEMSGHVIVTMNYRLGPLGFLSNAEIDAENPGREAGNFGLEDQRAALAWVQNNIAAFGGDPDNVTIFGESAGGMSVCLQLVSPQSSGLYHRAIMQSGPCSGFLFFTKERAEAQAADLATAAGCNDPETALSCLREKDAGAIIQALPPKPGIIAGGGYNWTPYVMQDPEERLAAGDFNQVPVLLGSNRDEGSLFLALGSFDVSTDEQYQQVVDAIFGPSAGAAIIAAYPSESFPSPGAAFSAVAGDGLFVCPARRAARAISAAAVPTYLYTFTHAIDFMLIPGLGAFHGSDIPFVFDNDYLGYSLSAAEEPLAAAMMGYWTRMASAGDPNGAGAVTWPAYDAAGDQHLVLDLTIDAGTGLKQAECDVWDAQDLVMP